MQTIRFLSRNKHKCDEAAEILLAQGIAVVPIHIPVEELQTDDTKRLVRHKVLEAFRAVQRPVFVEHTGLEIEKLAGLPGGLTQVFWDKLQADRFSTLFGGVPDKAKTKAVTTIAYCDGKKIHIFHGEVHGSIVPAPRGDRSFQWDCVFQPTGETRTFGEMGSEAKNRISMRRKALDLFAAYLGGS